MYCAQVTFDALGIYDEKGRNEWLTTTCHLWEVNHFAIKMDVNLEIAVFV